MTINPQSPSPESHNAELHSLESPQMASVSQLPRRTWPTNQQSPSQRLIEEAEREAVWNLLPTLEEMLEHGEPFAFLDFAARALHDVNGDVQSVLRRLRLGGWYEAVMLAVAMEWLHTGVQPESCMDPDTPDWLVRLDALEVTEARRQQHDDTTSFVIGLRLSDAGLGAFQARIYHAQNDALGNYFVLDDTPDTMARLFSAGDGGRLPAYQSTAIHGALTTLAQAVEQQDRTPCKPQLANPWPRNRALLDFVLHKTGHLTQ